MDSATNDKQDVPNDAKRNNRRFSHRGRDRGQEKSRGRGRGGANTREGQRGQDTQRGQPTGHRNRDTGRAEWSRNQVDKRARNEQNRQAAKRRKLEGKEEVLPIYATKFSQEEVEAQERKPKRKVAVMIGYSGSGYKGMQLNHHEKTIEGDLFSAFVAAGAISKANADDPKKSSLIRCARTDKGVHAAGNLISLKLIIEDSDIVAKINEHLSPQIRVWGIERTNGSFSAYQFCDSRVYEYLIPTHCFLPPHPKSFLAKQMVTLAEEAGDLQGFRSRQEEVSGFWSATDENYVKPVIEKIDKVALDAALSIFYEHDSTVSIPRTAPTPNGPEQERHDPSDAEGHPETLLKSTPNEHLRGLNDDQTEILDPSKERIPPNPLEEAVRLLKMAHIKAEKAYRIDPTRLNRVRSYLARFEGSHKYHNYTIDKNFKDPSATRVIKTFKVGENPIVIGNTEWLSLKVHGNSFMMHQIRKMVSMIALMVRCGCHDGRLQDSYMANKISIPKAPSLGLLLERPVFDVYNEKLEQFGREKIDFCRHEKEMEEFKQREIYERIFREEERDGCFHSFFTGLDNTRSAQLLYLSSVGVDATKREIPRATSKETMEKVDIDQVSSEDEGGGREEG